MGPEATITEPLTTQITIKKTGFDSDIECLQFTPHEISNYFRREKECGKKISEQKEDQTNKENSDEYESEETKGGENDQIDFSEE